MFDWYFLILEKEWIELCQTKNCLLVFGCASFFITAFLKIFDKCILQPELCSFSFDNFVSHLYRRIYMYDIQIIHAMNCKICINCLHKEVSMQTYIYSVFPIWVTFLFHRSHWFGFLSFFYTGNYTNKATSRRFKRDGTISRTNMGIQRLGAFLCWSISPIFFIQKKETSQHPCRWVTLNGNKANVLKLYNNIHMTNIRVRTPLSLSGSFVVSSAKT